MKYNYLLSYKKGKLFVTILILLQVQGTLWKKRLSSFKNQINEVVFVFFSLIIGKGSLMAKPENGVVFISLVL